jgi:hypothetical protein
MKTKAELAAANAYAAHVDGWKHGASLRAMDKRFTEISEPDRVYMKTAYELGYKVGSDARNIAQQDAAQIYDHRPEILRLQSELPKHVFASAFSACVICGGYESDPVHEVGS